MIVGALLAIGAGIVGWKAASAFYAERFRVMKQQLEGRTPEEAVEQIRALESKVQALERGQWRRITSRQGDQFVQTLRSSHFFEMLQKGEASSYVEIILITVDSEAESYAREFSQILHKVGIVAPLKSDNYFRPKLDKHGLVVLVKNLKDLKPNAQSLVAALESVQIAFELSSDNVPVNARDDYLGLRVGPKPEASAHSWARFHQ